MATTAAVLNILINANTGKAIASMQAMDAQMHKSAATANKTSSKVGAAFAKWGKAGAAGAAIGLGLALFSATKKTMEFEKQMSSLQATSSATRREMAQLEKQAIKMGAATVFSATEAAQAQIELAKGGLSVKQILGGGLRSALALAAAGELDLAEAATTTVNAMKLFEIGGRRSMRVADMLATAANTTTADVRDFAMALSQGGSVAKQAGYNLNETVVVLEALAEAGIKNSDAGTSMKAAFVQLLGPTAKQRQEADRLGMSFVDQNGQLKDAAGLANELRHGLAGMSDAQRAATLRTLAGTDGFRALAALYDAGAEKLDGFSKANRRQGTAAETARKKNNNLRGDLEQLSGAWETLQIIVGKKVTPILRDVAKWLTSVVRVVSALTGKSKRAGEEAEKFRDKNQALIAVMRIVWAVMKGVYNIFRLFYDLMFNTGKALKRLRTIAGNVAEGMRAVFDAAWLAIRTTFREGANAVIGIVNTIIGVLNKIPGVDIGKVGIILDPNIGKDANGPSLGRQRGGTIYGGKPSGDSVPALLERGEYVLNRKAVQKVGVDNLNRLNFKQAARFQTGGPIGMIGGGIADAVGNLASTAGGAVSGLAGKALGKGAGFFINQLPKPDLPSPFTALGPWLIEHVTDWIKGKVPKLGGSLGNVTGNLGQAMALAQQMGLTITSTTGGQHAPGSYHYQGRAFDASNGVNTPEMRNYFMAAAGKWGSSILELFYDPIGWYIKNGAKVPGAIGDHSDHVHTAMQQGGLVGLMRGGPAEHAVVKNVGKFLLNRGFDFRATAGILGNAWREGLWNPAQMEFTGAHNGGLYGFTTSPVSLQDMKNFASRRGKPWDDEIVQTNFMLSHGNPPGIQLRGAMNALETIPQTTEHFMSNWERPLASAAGLSERVAAGYDASNILRNAGIVRAGADDDSTPSPAQQRKSRRESRDQQVRDLLKKAFGARSASRKKNVMWQILDLYAKYGDFGKSRGGTTSSGGVAPGLMVPEAATFLQRAAGIASITNPNRGAGQLYGLVKWLQDNVEMTGSKDANEKLSDKLAAVRDAGGERAKAARQKIFKRIKGRGMDYPQKARLVASDRRLAVAEEWLNLAQQSATAESGPGGSEYTDAEVDYEVRLNKSILAEQQNRKSMLLGALKYLRGVREDLSAKVGLASKPGSSLAWKLGAFRQGLRATKQSIGDRKSDLETLVGVTGRGGTIFDTKLRLQELGVMSTVEKSRMGGIGISDLLQIVEFAKYGGYDSLPKFHSGGVIPGPRGQEVPIMAQAGETVVPNGGLGDVKVEVNFADGMGWLKEFVDVRVSENGRRSDQMMKAGVR